MTASVSVATGFLRLPSIQKSQNSSNLFRNQPKKKSYVRPISASSSEFPGLPELPENPWKSLVRPSSGSSSEIPGPELPEKGGKYFWKLPGGKGAAVGLDALNNQVLSELPQLLWITSDNAVSSKIGFLIGELKPWVGVALFLMREKYEKDSPWRLYHDALPQSTMSEEELAELKGTNRLDVKDYLESEFSRIEEEIILPNKDLFSSQITLDDFIWAFEIIRSSDIGLDGGEIIF